MSKTSKLTIITTKKKEKKVMITVATKKGSTQLPVRGMSSELEAKLKTHPDSLNNMEVEYEMEKGLITKIWEKGSTWQGNLYTPPPQQRKKSQGRNKAFRAERIQPRRLNLSESFHNPYNFVQALPRDQVNNELGDHVPQGQHVYHADLWSGWIEVELRTITPLLILDAARASVNRDDHKTFPVRVDAKGVPYLPPTSIKGMLRSAYETVTNSRLAVFEKHNERLAYRMNARLGIQMVPAVVEKGPSGLELRLVSNNTPMNENGAPINGLMYAAWLPRYQKYSPKAHYQSDKHESQQALRYYDGSLPQHGEPVWVRCQQLQHRSGYFSYAQVTDIRRRSSDDAVPPGYQAGIVCVTGRNMMNKHEERVFLLSQQDPRIELSPDLLEGWETLIRNYQHIHADEIQQRNRDGQSPDAYLGHEPGKTGWSRQVYTKDALELKEGSLCYARVENHHSLKILGLYPVMISRDLFNESPADLLDSSLHPARDISELSPAERVFGWLNQNGKGGWRGQLRVESAECEQGEEAIEYFSDQGIPLPILGEPKPQLARFYAARNPQGEPLPDNQEMVACYQDNRQGLRGRKVFPHHAHLANLHDYWEEPIEDRSQKPIVHQSKKYYQEYRRPTLKDERGKDKTRDSQNRSVQSWVKPETIFRFRMHISNLSSVELGALLWLLHLDEGHYHRLGSSKSLGFGSVQLKIKEMKLGKGKDWAAFYRNFLTVEQPCLRDTVELIDAYKTAVEEAYGKSFEQVPFIKAFRVALRGFKDGLPMHYPRLSEKPNPKGESFKWFVENERTKGPHLALPSLEDERGLPLLDS
jgi:CRISPR-associated protein (TIGR03986 family)